jgi:hypothetical protein
MPALPRTLIYKRTHVGDTDAAGRFGINGCMGRVRAWPFEAVIGVGGVGDQATRHGIADRVTWVGLGPPKTIGGDARGPLVTFDHFLLLDRQGPTFSRVAPHLARRIYSKNIRATMRIVTLVERREVAAILRLAELAPRSRSPRAVPRPDTSPCKCHDARCARCRDRTNVLIRDSCHTSISKRRHNEAELDERSKEARFARLLFDSLES